MISSVKKQLTTLSTFIVMSFRHPENGHWTGNVRFPYIWADVSESFAGMVSRRSAALSSDLLYRLMRLDQMLSERALRVKREEKVNLVRCSLLCGVNMRFQILIFHNHSVFLRKALQTGRKLDRTRRVDDKHAEEEPNHKGKRQIVFQPMQQVQDV